MSSRENVQLYGEYIFIFPRGKQQFLLTLLLNLLFYGFCFCCYIGELFAQSWVTKIFLLHFPLKNIKVLYSTFKYKTHFQLIFVCL